jgi:hypothetical protein
MRAPGARPAFPGPGGAGRLSTVSAIRRARLSEPVLSTFCSGALTFLTVAVKLASCISDFIIVGMIWSAVSAVVQFFAFSGEIWVTVAALANPGLTWLSRERGRRAGRYRAGPSGPGVPGEGIQWVSLLGLLPRGTP